MTGQDILPDISTLTISTLVKQFIIILIIITILFNFPKTFIIKSISKQNSIKSSSNQLPKPPLNYGQNLTQPMMIVKSQLNLKTSSYNLLRKIDHELESISVILIVESKRNYSESGILPFIKTLNYLFNYPYFKEFIIWNNDLKTHLQIQDYQFLYDDLIIHNPTIRIFNLPGNLTTSMSQHISCSLATYDTCYFNDEDTLHPNLDSLYTKYIETNLRSQFPITFTTNSINAELDPRDLNGSITNSVLFPKQLSTRFLRQSSYLSSSSSLALTEEEERLNEESFSIWVNRPMNRLLIQPRIPSTPTSIQPTTHAINVLEKVLKMYDPMISPDPFPLSIPYNSKGLIDEVGQVASLDDKVLGFSSESLENAMINLIDNDLNTCWKLNRMVNQKKFVGLNFILPISNLKSFEIILKNSSNKLLNLIPSLEFLQINSINWIGMDVKILNDQRIGFKDLENGYKDIKKIKFSFNDDGDEENEICGWIINDDWIL